MPAVKLARLEAFESLFRKSAPETWLMNKSLIVAALGLSLLSGAALANADLAKAKNCLACHAADKKVVGPSYKDVAAKYASDKDAVAKLAKKIREGGVGTWGQIPMPANPQVSEAEAQTLAKWVMTTK
jgi:cytochrome c